MKAPVRGVLLAGVGGQGVLLASHIAADALLRTGFDVKQSEVHGMSQRGGVVTSHLRFGDEVASPLIAAGEADLVIAFEWAEALRWSAHLRPGGRLVADPRRVVPPVACLDRRAWVSRYPFDQAAPGDAILVDATAIAREAGSERAAGSVLLGVASALLGLPEGPWEESIRVTVPSPTVAANLAAFAAGRTLRIPAAELPAHAPPRPATLRHWLEIESAWCKGCDICVRLCPERCLALDDSLKVTVTNPALCTGCRLCEMLCPDFAITVLSEEGAVA
ncbi:MAG: 2-oxoacid:acceptor oxidoreductase family protein [Candidatus Dormibacterales bacterium]